MLLSKKSAAIQEKIEIEKQKTKDLDISQMSIDLSDGDEDDDGGENPDDNNIDKAFKRLQKKKDKFLRFKRKLRERRKNKMKSEDSFTKSGTKLFQKKETDISLW